MLRENSIQADGVVIETLPNRALRVELANGHRLVARAAGPARLGFIRLAPGERVTVALSPYDLSRGRIVLKESDK